MFAAAATFAQMIHDDLVTFAVWLASKVFIVAIMAIMLPWILKGVFIWGFEYFVVYGREIANYILSSISSVTAGQYDFSIPLSGVGGYLAIQTGLIDYCSIIFTGWGIYWVIAVLAKSAPRL
jgi:hypothetical protein